MTNILATSPMSFSPFASLAIGMCKKRPEDTGLPPHGVPSGWHDTDKRRRSVHFIVRLPPGTTKGIFTNGTTSEKTGKWLRMAPKIR